MFLSLDFLIFKLSYLQHQGFHPFSPCFNDGFQNVTEFPDWILKLSLVGIFSATKKFNKTLNFFTCIFSNSAPQIRMGWTSSRNILVEILQHARRNSKQSSSFWFWCSETKTMTKFQWYHFLWTFYWNTCLFNELTAPINSLTDVSQIESKSSVLEISFHIFFTSSKKTITKGTITFLCMIFCWL